MAQVWVDDLYSEAGGYFVDPDRTPENLAREAAAAAQSANLQSQLDQRNTISSGLADTYNQYSPFKQPNPNAQVGGTLSSLYNAQSPDGFISNQDFSSGNESFDSIDKLIQGRTAEALGIAEQGSAQQLGLTRAATQAGLAPLQQADDLRAFNEQQSLLGLNGQQAQQQAIGGIPVSEFEAEMQRRQQKQLQRGAAARGELGGGAAFEAGAQLAGAQQANIIQNRLGQLEPLVALSRGVRSDMSGQIESGAVRAANIQQGLGVQQGNIRLGATAPIIQGVRDRAEVSGLQGVANANRQASQNNQLANLGGTLATSYFGGK